MDRVSMSVFVVLLAGCATTASPPSATAVQVAPAEESTRIAVSNIRDSTDLRDVEALAHALPFESTLVVFDIDDTVLTAQRFFGSDTWYRWQSKLPPESPDKVQCLFNGLLGFDYEAARLKPTQPDAAEIFNRIPNDKLFLTSRSPDYRGGTERELRNIGILWPPSIVGAPTIVVDDGKHMVYDNGIYMTIGHDKGLALEALLQVKGAKRYQTVILVDDGGENIDRMRRVLAKMNINYYGMRYFRIKEDPYPKPFPPPTPEQIGQARAEMTHWLKFMRDQYPERYAALKCGSFPIPNSRH
jgi:uncharacterized lipoprotein YbaY